MQDAAAALPARLFGDVRGRARRRSVRRARRQDRAACRRRRARHRGRPRAGAAGAACAKISARLSLAAELVCADAAAWTAEHRSTPCCSMRPAPRPAPSAAIPTCRGSRAQPTSRSSPACSAACSTRAIALTKPGGTLVYCTCSLEPEEDEDIVAELLARERQRAARADRRGGGFRPATEFITQGRRPAHAALPASRCRFAACRPRRLLCRAAGKRVAISNRYAARWPFCQRFVMVAAAGCRCIRGRLC